MNSKTEKQLILTLTGKEVDSFTTLIKKVAGEVKKPGFTSVHLTDEERDLLNNLNKEIL